MANENLGSTVLHEHRKIVAFRYILALVNFIAILTSTVITRHFVLVRGTSDGVLLIINILCVINAIQIILCISDYITKVMLGKYLKALTIASYVFGAIWVAAVIAEFISGSVAFDTLRVDLGSIAALQFFSALIAYIVWPFLDYLAIRKMTHKNVRDDIEKRASKARGGIIKYVLVCVFMVFIQIAMLFAYKLPPQVYDLFSESRQLQYKLSEDGESYEVIGIYHGTSSYVNVPAVYNNKPVTKISSGALSNDPFLENHKVDRIEIGTATTDENGVTTVVSNVIVIESGAIQNDKITTLTLPVSIIKIEDGAIDSSSLKTLIYESKADFSYSYLSCSALSTVTFNGLEAGKIVSLNGMSDTVTLEVPKDIYNNYREKNKDYMSSIRPILSDTEFVVDFYTNSDYYIDSIFCTRGETVEVSYRDLKNDRLVDMIAPSVDTIAYINNRHETGTVGAKSDSAFRGWYFDQFFTSECSFGENNVLSFTGDTAIYAKWIDEYTGQLDWGTYHPDGQPMRLYWTDEDLVVFPVIEDRVGFKNGIVWSIDDQTVTSSQNVSKSVTVNGKWIFDAPTIDINPYAQKSSDKNFVISTDKNTISFVYDEYQKLHLEALMSHEFDNYENFSYSTKWTKSGSQNFNSANKTIDIQNVLESGEYKLRVTAKSPYGDESFAETTVMVSIAKKELDIGTAKLDNMTVVYDAQERRLVYKGTFVHDKISTSYTYYDANGNVIEGADGVKNVGKYKVVALFSKNNAAEAENYSTKELNAELVITPYQLEFIGWNYSSLVYNTAEQTVKLLVNGIRANDAVEIIYEGNKAKNAGTYTAKAVGVSNPNYSISDMDAANKCTHTWTITPKEISIKEWKLDGSVTSSFSITYNGKPHTIEAVADGVYASDRNNIKFIYEQVANTVTATDANKYTAKIVGVENTNYTLTSESTQAWEITKKNVSVYFDKASSLTYNGNMQGVTAMLSGIVEKDMALFTREKLLFEGKSDGLTVGEVKVSGTGVALSFSAKNAATYIAYISGIDSAADINLNYTLTAANCEFNISPKTITVLDENVYTYNGKTQSLGIKIQGIESSDLDSVSFDQFTSTTLSGGEKSGNDYILTLTGKDAGNYAYDVTAFSNTNYNLVGKSGELKIAKQVLTVNWQITDLETQSTKNLSKNAAVVYNAKGYSINADISGIADGETVNLNYISGQIGQDAGSYTTTVSLSEDYVNYAFESESISWRITPYTIDFSWTFNGEEQSVSGSKVPTFTYNANPITVAPVYNLLGTDTITITYDSSKCDLSKTDASVKNYAIAIQDIGNSNYKIGKNSSFEWKIEPKTVTVSWADNPMSVTYDGKYHGPQFTINGIVENGLKIQISVTDGDNKQSTTNLDITSADEMTKYDFISTSDIINANKYVCNVIAVYKLGSDSTYIKDTNYQIACDSVNYEVNRAPLTLAGWVYETGVLKAPYTNSTVLVYNQNNYVLTNSINEQLFARNGVTDSVSLSYTNNEKSQYSESGYVATVTLSGTHAANYIITSETTLSWRIEQKPILAIWNSNEVFVYDGYYKSKTATYETGATDSNDNKVYSGDYISFSYSGNRYYDAGSYTVYISNIGNSNYKLVESSISFQWNILPKEVKYSDLYWSASEFTYNANNQYPTAYFYDSYLGTTINVKEYDKPTDSKNANTTDGYTIRAVSLSSANYTLVGDDLGHKYVIKPKVVHFTWGFGSSTSNAYSYYYDGVERTVSAKANAYEGDNIEITYNQTDLKVRDAGTYEFSIKEISNPNYVLNASSTGTAHSLEVYKRTASLIWKYDGETTGAGNFTYDGDSRKIQAYVSNLCSGDTVTLTYSPETNLEIVNAGTYTMLVSGISNSNYVLPSANECTKTITVNKQTLALTWTGDVSSITYDGKAHTLTALLEGVISGTKISVAPQYSADVNSYIDAGSYTIAVSGMGTSENSVFNINNFQLPSNTSKTLTIKKQTLKVTWLGNTDVVYNGQNNYLYATLSGTINEENITVAPVYSNNVNSRKDYGTTTITVSGMGSSNHSGFKSSNFQLPTDGTHTSTLKINQYEVNLTWSGETSVIYDGLSHSLTAKAVGVDGKEIVITYSNNSKTASGTYSVRAVLSDSNYKISTSSTDTMTLVINPQPVKITWSAAEIEYDGYSHRPTATVVGANDNSNVSFAYSSTKTLTDVGSYTYTISLNDSNYTLTGATGDAQLKFSIKPQTVKIRWDGDKTYKYTGNTYYLTPTVTNKSGTVNVPFLITGTTSFSNVGVYTATIYALETSNYTLEGCDGSLSATAEVVPMDVRIVWSETDLKYNGQYQYFTAKVLDENGSELNFTYQTIQSGMNIGTYTVVIKLSGAASNYNIISGSLTQTFTIS